MLQLTINAQDPQVIIDTMRMLYTQAESKNIELPFCHKKQYLEVAEECKLLKEQNKKSEELCKQVEEKWENECLSTEQLKNENETLKNDRRNLENTIKKLTYDNDSYREKLNRITIGYGPGDNNEILYFNVKDNKLERTTVRGGSFYKAVKDGNSYEFEFNEENAKHIQAISEKHKFIEPFCEISNNSTDSANYVKNKSKGMFIKSESTFQIIKKVEVCLIQK